MTVGRGRDKRRGEGLWVIDRPVMDSWKPEVGRA